MLQDHAPSVSDARATSLLLEAGGTLTDAAYDALRVDIIRGLRGPGERLRIERLKALYGVGPPPGAKRSKGCRLTVW